MLDVMVEENLGNNVKVQGERIMDRLRAMMDKYSIIGDVRGLGLMIGVELVRDRNTKEPADELTGFAWEHALREERLLLGKSGPVFGNYGNVIKLKPAVNSTSAEVDEMMDRLDRVFAATQKRHDDGR